MTNTSRHPNLRTLAIDIGGSGIKTLLLGADGGSLNERHRELTPRPSTPDKVMAVVSSMIDAQSGFDRVSVGFPGVVKRGVVSTAPNLGTRRWRGFELERTIADHAMKPVRAINDADLQGYGVIEGKGVEMVLTLGTGLGSGLYVDGTLVPNLELGHHPLRKGHTYEQLVGNAALDEVGKKRWRKRIAFMIGTLEPIFNYDVLYIGGGNARALKGTFPRNVRFFTNVEGLSGGVRVWTTDRQVST